MNKYPEQITDEQQLEELLALPPQELIEFMRRLDGDIMILGIAGKVGVSLGHQAVNAIRAAGVEKRVIGVARFSNPESRRQLEAWGVETISCDLMDAEAVCQLPQVKNVIFMAGRKFGTDGSEDVTWAMNVLVPAHVGAHFKSSRIVVFSTGCVYPLVGVESCGCDETVPPQPIGEYSQSCLGRERIFEYCARTYGTQVLMFRLNYAVDLRYGVLHDIAMDIINDRPVNNSVGFFNVIWQGDVTANAIRALEMCSNPPAILNVTGPETASVAKAAKMMGAIMGKDVTFKGEPGDKCYLNDASLMCRVMGYPRVSLEQMIRWQASWIANGGVSIGKPTHFEVNNGKF